MALTVLAMLAAVAGCRSGSDDGGNMPQRDIKTVMDAHAAELMAIDGVAAVAVSALEDGTPCIKVYVVKKTDAIARRIPKEIEGYRVVVEESGTIEPLGG